ncbi:MAG: DNA repair protein RecN, partial [Micrococcales bacterium]
MIQEIHIRDLGVIREARLPFEPGLNVLTGETGAGKTMVLTALGLLLGNRADSGMIRAGASQLLVEGHLKVNNDAVSSRVAELGGEIENQELIVARTVSVDKSRATIGGVSTPAGVLDEVGAHLVVVHGQADQIRLKSTAAQREALDDFANLRGALVEYRKTYDAWKQAQAALHRLKQNQEISLAEIESLRNDIALFDAISPKPHEDVELAEQIKRLENTESLRAAALLAHEALSSADDAADALSMLGKARKALESELQNDSALEQIHGVIQDSFLTLREIAGDLSSYVAKLEAEEGVSLEAAQDRKSKLTSLTRKHGPTLVEVFEWHQAASLRLLDLDSSDDRLEQLAAEIQVAGSESENRAMEISKLRLSAAAEMAALVNAELEGLAMKGAQLVVSVETGQELGPHGGDVVSINLQSYPGAEPRPLGKGASGGELSRIMLAIEVVLARDSKVPTFVFDEVDAGVGGATAIEVGKRLAQLALR